MQIGETFIKGVKKRLFLSILNRLCEKAGAVLQKKEFYNTFLSSASKNRS